MKGKRLLHTLRLWTILSSSARANYLRKNKVFGAIGQNCLIMDRKVPLYAELIRLGDNVRIASDVTFITHDVIHLVLNNMPDAQAGKFREKIGCIEIGSNVFVGTGTKIMGDVKIGDNVIIAAGSLITKDIPSGSVAAGVPARVIGSMDTFIDNRLRQQESWRPSEMRSVNEAISSEMQEWMWNDFNLRREKNTGED